MAWLKKIASKLPYTLQNELKRLNCWRLIRSDKFIPYEPEFNLLEEFVREGDWVVDVGANHGFYTKRLSELVGAKGRVIAMEPIIETFSILASNSRLFGYPNVTLLNMAASDGVSIAGMDVPVFESGLKNFYEACIMDSNDCAYDVLTFSIDSFSIPHQVTLVKIDTEGHEAKVIEGMTKLIQRDHPTLIVETFSDDVIQKLEGFGYKHERLPKSPNALFTH